jgi:WD40 repeat protein
VHVEITPDGRYLVTVTHEGFRLWDLATGELVGAPIAHDGWVTYRAFSADSRLLAGAFGSTVLVWDIETGDLVIPLCLISDGMMWYVLLDSDTGGLASCGSTIGR